MKDIIEKLGITPGPLHVEKLSKTCYSIVDDNLDGLMNCVSDNDEDPTFFGGVYNKKDAELFAAAPEMLEALIKVLENEHSYVFDDDYEIPLDSGSTEETVICIIEKATGKTWEEIKELLNEH